MRRARWVCAVVLALAGAAPATAAAGGNLYATDATTPGALRPFDIGAGGALAAKSPSSVPTVAAATVATLTPDGRHLYDSAGTSPGAVGLFDVGGDGTLTAKSPATMPVGNGGIGVTASPDGASLYVANRDSGTISQFDVHGDGSLTSKNPATVTTAAKDQLVAVSPDGRSAYVPHVGANKFVSQFDVGTDGTLKPKTVATVPAGDANSSMVLSPNGRNAYVTALVDNAVLQYDIDAGGNLKPKTPASVTVPGALWAAISPDGHSLYVRGKALIAQFDVAGDGALSPKSPATVPVTGDEALIAAGPDGSVYTTDAASSVLQFNAGAGGALTAKNPAAVPAGTLATGVAVRPDQAPEAAFSVAAAPAGSATAFDASATGDAVGNVTRYDWDFGDGASAANAGAKPSHAYAQPGTYTAKLTATADQGCSTAQISNGLTTLCNGGPSAVTTRTVTVTAPPGPPPPPPFPILPSSAFRFVALSATRGGTLTAVIDTQAAGMATATATTRVRKAVRRGSKKKRRGRLKTVAYGTGSATTAGPGRLIFHIRGGRAAAAALKRVRKLHVRVAITFDAGGPTDTETRSVTVKAATKRKRRGG